MTRGNDQPVVAAAVLGVLVAVSSVACGGTSDPSAVPSMHDTATHSRSVGNSTVPPGDHQGGIDSLQTKRGRAAFDLAVEPREVEPDGQVSIRSVNRGEVRLGMGTGFTVERWEEGQWVDVPFPDGAARSHVILFLEPGATSDWDHTWPLRHLDSESMQPGWYRVTKSATIEHRGGDRSEDARELVAHALFRVES